MSLDQAVIDRALAVKADDASHPTARAVMNGAVVIYNLDAPPQWLIPFLELRGEDGNVPFVSETPLDAPS